MLITKLYYGLGLVLLGCFPNEYLDIETVGTSKKNTLLVEKTKKIKGGELNLQDPGKEIYTDFCIFFHFGKDKGNV